MSRPEKKNAMDPRFHDDMVAVRDALRHDDETHVVAVSGDGAMNFVISWTMTLRKSIENVRMSP